MKKLLIIVNDPAFFMSHRSQIAVEAQRKGFDVHVATATGESIKDISLLGFVHHVLPLSRSGMNPFREINSIYSIFKLFRKVQPDVCHLVTIKPVLYGGIAARFIPSMAMLFAISGLGSVFTPNSLKAKVLKTIITGMYKLALSHKQICVIFQNSNDKSILIKAGAVEDENTLLIKGSGVELSKYCYQPAIEKPNVTVVMACRLLREKGVVEFIEAAKILRSRGLGINFNLIGTIDPGNPETISQQEIDTWKAEGVVNILGFCDDMEDQLKNSDIVTLPSYYGEGLPKVLIEASACGRAIITTDHPGCRDAIIPDISGVLIPVKNANALADAIQKLSDNTELRNQMGIRGRRLAEQEFDVNLVVEKHLDVYNKLVDGR